VKAVKAVNAVNVVNDVNDVKAVTVVKAVNTVKAVNAVTTCPHCGLVAALAHPQMCAAQICAMRELPWNACLMRVSAAAFFLLIQVKGFQCSGEHF
jgi:hypothetical protein